MSLVTRSRHQLTVDQIYAIAELEYDIDAQISRSRPGDGKREIELEFTTSKSGGRHVYIRDIDDEGYYHIARNGNITWCERT